MRSFSVFSVVLFVMLSPLSKINSYCSETSSGASDTWTMTNERFLELAFSPYAKEISHDYVIWNSFGNLTYDGFNYWLQNTDNGEHYHVLTDGNVVGHGGAGYARDSDKIDNSTSIEVDPELKQLILNYVQVQVTENPESFKRCYLYSYNFLSPSAFSTYAMYASTKEYLKQGGNRYSVIFMPNSSSVLISQYLTQDQNLGFVGTTTLGSFTSVQPYVNWQTLGNYQLAPAVSINQAGTVTNVTNNNWYGYNNLKNTATPSASAKIIMSPNEKNELVYVFETLNAYKNYNAGMAQPYYLTSDGVNVGTWTSDGQALINTGEMLNSGNYYNSVVNNVQTGWTAQEVLELVDKISNTSGGSGGSSDKDNPFSFLGKLGDLIGDLVSGVGDLLTGIVEGIANVFLGTPDENGVRQGGLFSIVRSVINGIVELIDTDFVEFFNVVFDWLPQEIITLMIAGLTFALFFGILKMIRG